MVVSGPVGLKYPRQAEVIPVVSTADMLAACLEVFPGCDGLIAVAAPCDYRPRRWPGEDSQDGRPAGNPVGGNARHRRPAGQDQHAQWMVAFALETEDRHLRAMQKLEQKNCDLIVVNGPAAIDAGRTQVEVLGPRRQALAALAGSKRRVAREILEIIARRLMRMKNPEVRS